MSPRGSKKPHAAFCEEYNEDTHSILPETRQVAYTATKRSTTDLGSRDIIVDLGSDSGYSSRTAATINSNQSPPSGRRSPATLRVETNPSRLTMERIRDLRREKGRKEGRGSSSRRPTLESVQDDAMRNARIPSAAPVSPVKQRRRESASIRHHPGSCWECEQGLYHPSPPIEPHPMDVSYYYQSHPQVVQTVPPSPTTIPYPIPFSPDVTVAANPHLQRRMSQSSAYYSNGRPMSFHGMTPDMYAASMSMNPFDSSGASMSASAYSQMVPYHASSPFAEQSQYYMEPDPAAQPVYERPRKSSMSRPKERSRRPSHHGPPIISQASRSVAYDEGVEMERRASREQRERRDRRARATSHSQDLDEDYYLMPPPPPPKHKSPPAQVVQKRPELSRKSATVSSGGTTTARRPSNVFNLADLEAALPDRIVRKMSRDPLTMERSQSLRNTGRTTSYQESSRPTRISVESSRRRRTSYFEEDPEPELEPEPEPEPLPPSLRRSRTKDTRIEMDQKQRKAEEYQAARSGRAVPLTEDALLKAKASASRPNSETSSSKSHASSSRNSDSHSQDGSLAGSRVDDNRSFTMTMNGLIMSFPNQPAISFRPGEQGAVELNFGGRRPKRYLMTRSDHTSSSIRREIEDLRSSRDDRRSDRASRRSSRSNHSGR